MIDDQLDKIKRSVAFAVGLVPEHMRDGLMCYVMRGLEPGDFLYKILCNDFMGAARHADYVNFESFGRYARSFYNLPCTCYGSPEAVNAWIAEGGVEGKLKKTPKPTTSGS